MCDGKIRDWSVINRPRPYGIPQSQAKTILEAAMHGLPVMCFSPREEPGSGIWKANKKLIHFDAVLNCPLVFKATKYSEFLSEIGKLLNTERTQKFEEQMKFFASNFIEDITGGYADSLLTIVEELIASRQHR